MSLLCWFTAVNLKACLSKVSLSIFLSVVLNRFTKIIHNIVIFPCWHDFSIFWFSSRNLIWAMKWSSNMLNPILKVCSISNCSAAVIEWKSAWAKPWSKIEGWSSFATRWYDSKFKISRLLAGILAAVFLSWYRIRVDVSPGCVFV